MLSPKKFALVCALLFVHQNACALSSNSRNDYFPLYKTWEPHAFLYTRTKDQLHGRTDDQDKLNKFSLCVTPFGQNAEVGRNIDDKQTQLGSVAENWSMIALLMGDFPKGQTLSSTLATARAALYQAQSATVPFESPKDIDCSQKFGFFEFPGIYRKRGLRFE